MAAVTAHRCPSRPDGTKHVPRQAAFRCRQRALLRNTRPTVNVEGEHGERHHAGKAIRTQGQHPLKATGFEIVDAASTAGGWRRTAVNTTPCSRSRSAWLRSPFLRQPAVIEQVVETDPVRGTVKASGEAQRAGQGRKPHRSPFARSALSWPGHMPSWCRTKPCGASRLSTGTPRSTGTPA